MHIMACSDTHCKEDIFGPDMGTQKDKGWICIAATRNGRQYLCPEHAATYTLQQKVEVVPDSPPPNFDSVSTEAGSENRFPEHEEPAPWILHRFWWMIHNLVAHPLIAVFPVTLFFTFHDWTGEKMNGVKS